MRTIAASTTVLLLALRLDAAAQGPADDTKHDHASAPMTVASADPPTHPALRSNLLAVRGQDFETWSAVGPANPEDITAPLSRGRASNRSAALPQVGPGARTAGRIGAIVGTVAGALLGRAAFEGVDMGCDRYGECFGRANSGEAVMAGAAVMGGVGFMAGTLIGLLAAKHLDQDGPLGAVGVSVSPRGHPGVRFSASVRF
jgi:hypothetical protein